MTPGFWFEQLGMMMILTTRRKCRRTRFESQDNGGSFGDVESEVPVAETCNCTPTIHSEELGIRGRCTEPRSD